MKKLRKVNSRERKAERKNAQEKLQGSLSLMLDMPTECTTCHTPFDKKSREMAMTWNVTVYASKKKVYLSCPECWVKIEETRMESSDGKN